jgi:hypothetical protein
MNLFPSWKLFFAARESNNAGNKNPAAYLTAWSDIDTTPEAKLHLLENDPTTAILAGDINNGIMILHSFKNLGGTILSPSDKYVCLMGSARMAPIVIVNAVVASDTCSITTPSAEDILACTNLDELLLLQPPLAEETEETITYTGGTTFLPPPWLLNTVIDAHTDDPFKLILAAKQGAIQFNSNQLTDDPLYMANTNTTVNHFATWAWGIKRNFITPTSFFLDPYDIDVDNYHTLRHQLCISSAGNVPNTPQTVPIHAPAGTPPNFNLLHPAIGTVTPMIGNDTILQQLAVSITRQSEEAATHNELFARQLEHSLEKEDKKKDRLKKFHPSIKQLILFASADDAESTPEEILDSCKRVFNAETLTNAEQELSLQFGNLGMQDAYFAPSFISALYSGKFIWSKNFSPSNFSPFMICEAEPLLATDHTSRRLTLHLEETNGKTAEDISAGGKNSIKAPTTYHEMHQQLKFFHGACSIFFGPISIACASLAALITVVEKNKHIFKTQETDIEFMSKFLLAIDKRFQLWLDNCMTLTDRSEVDDAILNFLPLIDGVRYGTFDLRLPLTFKLAEPDKPEAKDNRKRGGGGGQNETAGGENENKKKKQKSVRTLNDHQPEQLKMRAGEIWATTFANKNIQARVQWGTGEDTTKMCPRWFIAGYCFENCFHKNSHVKANEIPADKLVDFKTFLDGIRNGS